MGHIKNCCPNNAASRSVVTAEPQDFNDIVFQNHVIGEELSTPSSDSTNLDQSCDLLSISADLLSHMECINERFQRMKPHDAPYLTVH